MNLDFIYEIQNKVPLFLMVFARLSGLLWTLPLTSYTTIPNRVRVGLAILFTLIVIPLLPSTTLAVNTLLGLFLAILMELIVGMVLGFGGRVIFEAFNMAGSFVGRQMGLLLANVLDPTSQDQTPLMSQMWFFLLLMIFLLTNGHYLLIELLGKNFQSIPLMGATLTPAAGRTFAESFQTALRLGLSLGLPAMLFLLIVDTAIAFTARVMPQMNIFFVTLPVKIGLGFIVLIISLDIFQVLYDSMLSDMNTYFRTMLIQLAGA
ncbi:MAG: flagellar biosynthetic protein FliR [FCB group bacterium]|nr:flagellar biosynthetic protein FliR [FCB group bacterium]